MIHNSLELAALTVSLASGAASASDTTLTKSNAPTLDVWPGSAETTHAATVSTHITLKGNKLTVV